MLKNKDTYEIMSPEDIGLLRSNESGIVLGKLRYVVTFPAVYFSNLSVYLVMVFVVFKFSFFGTYSVLHLFIKFYKKTYQLLKDSNSLKAPESKLCSKKTVLFK